MTAACDPFAHHPELRGKIIPADQSFFRDFSTRKMRAMLAEKGLDAPPMYDDATREGLRHEALADVDGDLWVFAYGSLIWDPALNFIDVRRAFAPNHARRFILRDIYGGRGTPDQPGLMAALDTGPGCHGLAFRIAATEVDAETQILCRRELLLPAYLPAHVPIDMDGQRGSAFTFVANPDADSIDRSLTRETQVAYLASGKGFLGSSLDYLKNIVDHLHDCGIPDADLDQLLSETLHQMNMTGA